MKSMFWRIFLWFWLALVSLVGGALVLTQMVNDQRLNALEGVDPRQLSHQACMALATGGVASLRDWVVEQEDHKAGLDIFIMTAEGSELLQRQLPERLLDWDRYLRREGHMNIENSVYQVTASCRPRLGGHWLAPKVSQPSQTLSWAWRETPELLGAQGERFRVIYEPSYYPPLAPREFLALGGRYLWVLSLVGLIGSGAACWALARQISIPIKNLQLGVRQIANGHLGQRAPAALSVRGDEIGELARDFDSMAGQLGELIEDKHLLLRNVAHELRSPLARLHLALTLARRKDASLDRQFDRVEREGARLNQLIGELLTFDRLGVHGLSEMGRVDFNALVGEVVEDARFLGGALSQTVVWNPCPQPAWVWGRREALHSAIDNIVRNALHYSPPASVVGMDVSMKDGQLFLSVIDQGPGVPYAELERIFEPFYRVSSARERKKDGGAGLGLAIAARVAGVHKGSLRASNLKPTGLAVVLSIPVAPCEVTQEDELMD